MSTGYNIENDSSAIPDNLDEAIRVLEDRHTAKLEEIHATAPGPLAPIGEKIAYTLRVAHVKADGEVISLLHEHRDESPTHTEE